MIPATSFLVDGDTALLVHDDAPGAVPLHWQQRNRPCDTCNGSGERHYDDAPPRLDGCPDCDGTGRHTFGIHIEIGSIEAGAHGYNAYRVHVIDVLRVCDPATGCPGPASPHICWSAVDRRVGSEADGCWLLVTNTLHDASPSITLPPDAAPGKWLVRLAVHQ